VRTRASEKSARSPFRVNATLTPTLGRLPLWDGSSPRSLRELHLDECECAQRPDRVLRDASFSSGASVSRAATERSQTGQRSSAPAGGSPAQEVPRCMEGGGGGATAAPTGAGCASPNAGAACLVKAPRTSLGALVPGFLVADAGPVRARCGDGQALVRACGTGPPCSPRPRCCRRPAWGCCSCTGGSRRRDCGAPRTCRRC
jgi:hypothetical protein